VVRLLTLEGQAMKDVMEKTGLKRREVGVMLEQCLSQLRRVFESLGLEFRHLVN
jgi:hypothetical protein